LSKGKRKQERAERAKKHAEYLRKKNRQKKRVRRSFRHPERKRRNRIFTVHLPHTLMGK